MSLEGDHIRGRSGPDFKLPAAEGPGTDQSRQVDVWKGCSAS